MECDSSLEENLEKKTLRYRAWTLEQSWVRKARRLGLEARMLRDKARKVLWIPDGQACPGRPGVPVKWGKPSTTTVKHW